MLSICIPVYNLNVKQLVLQLAQQCIDANIEFEIVLADDGSIEDKNKIANRELSKLKYINYFEMPYNVGRSKIRNKLSDLAKYNYMLFIDCDSLVENPCLIKNYLKNINNKVVCGGSIYSKKKPPFNKRLRWKYGIMVESNQKKQRENNSAKSFMTNNFLIQKSVMDKVKFNESLSKYGHEDTLFGYDLKKIHIYPVHINNPVLNCHIDTNKVFLKKTQLAVKNLAFITKNVDNPQLFINEITLLKTYHKLPAKAFLKPIFKVLYPIIGIIIKSGYTNLTLFNIYKLAYLCVVYNNKN